MIAPIIYQHKPQTASEQLYLLSQNRLWLHSSGFSLQIR